MDITTLLGLVIGVIVVLLAVMTGSDLGIFLNIPGFLIVVGGTLAATLIKFPLSIVFSAFATGLKAAFVNERDDVPSMVELAVVLARESRKNGMLALENAEIKNPFFKKGIQYCVDGHDPEFIHKALVSEMNLTIKRHEEGSEIFRAIGDSAPAFGMIGTLVGLVQMLTNMDDPKTIGPAMAIALLTTLYGALIANLVALPIASKLKKKTEHERVTKSLIIDAVTNIQSGTSHSALEELLSAYLPETRHRAQTKAASQVPQPAE